MSLKITDVQLDKQSFKNDVRGLPKDVRDKLRDRIKLLKENPRAGKLRLHDLRDFNPKIWKFDVTDSGKMYQATFRLEGSTAVMLRVGSHKSIDRCPK